MFPENSKNSFNLETGNETFVCFFEPKRKCSNIVWATKNAVRPSIAKRQCTVKKVLYEIFFDNKGPVMQLPVPKGRTVTFVLKKLKAHFKRLHPKTGLEYLHFLHDNASAHKARIVNEFLESEKVNVLPYPPFSPDLVACDFLFPKLKVHLYGKKDISQEMLLGLLYISSSWVCLFRTMNGAFKIGLTA